MHPIDHSTTTKQAKPKRPHFLSPKYISVLAIAAFLILVIGTFIKPEPQAAEPPPLPETELQRLMRLAQRRSLQDTASFFAQLGSEVEAWIVALRELPGSAVIWAPTSGILVTGNREEFGFGTVSFVLSSGEVIQGNPLVVLPGAPLALFQAAVLGETSTRFADIRLEPVRAGEWVLVLGRDSDRELLFLYGQAGGTVVTECNGKPYPEILLGFALKEQFLGSGVFDLEGRLVGVIGRCNDQLVALQAQAVSDLLGQADDPANQILTRFGMRLEPLGSVIQELTKLEHGFLVAEIWDASLASLAGLQAGDVIVEVNQRPLASREDLQYLLLPGEESRLQLKIWRQNRLLQLNLEVNRGYAMVPRRPVIGVVPKIERGLVIETVLPQSWAASMGLRPGDILLRVNDVAINSAAQLSQLVPRLRYPALLIVQRGPRQVALVVSS